MLSLICMNLISSEHWPSWIWKIFRERKRIVTRLFNVIRLWLVLIRFVVWRESGRVNLTVLLKTIRKRCIMIRRTLLCGIIWHYHIFRRKIMIRQKKIWRVCWKYLRVILALTWWEERSLYSKKTLLPHWMISIKLLNWINTIRTHGQQERSSSCNSQNTGKRNLISIVLFIWVLRMPGIILIAHWPDFIRITWGEPWVIMTWHWILIRIILSGTITVVCCVQG